MCRNWYTGVYLAENTSLMNIREKFISDHGRRWSSASHALVSVYDGRAVWLTLAKSPTASPAASPKPGPALDSAISPACSSQVGHQPRPPMAHFRWQKPANGSDMLAIAQIRWHKTMQAFRSPRNVRAERGAGWRMVPIRLLRSAVV